MSAQLSLVKSLSHLQQEQSFAEEIFLKSFGLALTRGSVVEISGTASSGKISIATNLLAKLTQTGEVCAIVDAVGGFDPQSATRGGVCLENILWIKCGGDVEKTFLSADHLIQAKGFGAIWLNLSGLQSSVLCMVPKTYWYRFRTRIKDTQTILLATSAEPVSSSASQSAFTTERKRAEWSGNGQFKLLRWLNVAITPRKGYTRTYPSRIEMDYTEV